MKNKAQCFCNSISDKDFIFEIFSNNGFVQNADSFLSTDRKECKPAEGQCEEALHLSDTDK